MALEREIEEADRWVPTGDGGRKRNPLSPGTELTEWDLRRALDVRKGLHALVRANSGKALDSEAVNLRMRSRKYRRTEKQSPSAVKWRPVLPHPVLTHESPARPPV